MSDINLRILMSASQGNTMSVIGGIKNALDKGGLGGALTAVTAGAAGLAVALGVDAVKKASDFQNAMDQNVAHAGLAQSQFNAVSQSVLQMSTDVGQMPTDLAQALYPILSGLSGITDQSAKAQTSMEALRLSAMAVTGTTVDTTTVSNALIGSFNALGLQTNNTATNLAHLKTLADQMEATIIAGNMHWDTYAGAASKVAIAIKGTNISWIEGNAALATMTNQSMSATKASTYLANFFNQVGIKADTIAKNAAKLGGTYDYTTSKTKQLYDATHHLDGKLITIKGHLETLYTTHAKQLGIGFDEVKFKTMDLAQKMLYLTQITHGNQGELLKLLGGNATALRTYNMLYPSMKAYQANLEAIKNSHGAAATAFATASSGFQAAGKRMKSAIAVLLIDLGTQLQPVLTKLLDWVTPLIKQFANWVLTNQGLHQWLSNVGGYIQNTLIPTVQKIGQAVFNFVGWMQKGSAPAQALKGVLEGVGFAIAAMKVGKLAQDIAGMGKNAADFVSGAGKNLLAFLTGDTGLQGAADKTGASINTMGNDAAISSGKVTTLGSDSAAAAVGETTLGDDAEAAAGKETMMGDAAAGAVGKLSGLMSMLQGLSLMGVNIGEQSGASGAQSQINATQGQNMPWLQYEWEKIHGFQNFGKMPAYSSMTGAQQSQIVSDWYKQNPGKAFPWSTVVGFASGGPVMQTGLALVHQGEYVIPAGRSSNVGGHTFNISLVVNNPMRTRNDLVTLVDDIERELAQRFRSQTGNYATGGTF